MKLGVSNMPSNTLYKFDINKYVWSTMLNESRSGNYKQNQPIRYTEVYEISEEGYINLIASGRLTPSDDVVDYTKGFSIWDYDKEGKINFNIKNDLQEIKLNELYEIRDAIGRNYRGMNK